MAKRKTLPKDFEQLVQTASDENIKKVLGKCDINAYGGYNKGNALEFPLSEEMMRWLIEQGIDINYVDQYGYTPLLYHAGRMSSEKQAIALVKLGADITATQGLDRETVMHVAVKTGNLELVKCLIQAGADAEVTSRSGETPLERAFHWARTFDLIKLAPVAEYLIGIGVPVTDKIRTYMRKHDAEYQRLQNKILELTERYPVIETFMESNQAISLTTEEHKAVHQYFRLESEKEMIEEQYHFIWDRLK